MRTIATPKNVTQRSNTSAALLAAAKSVDTKPIRARLTAFALASRAHDEAEAAVKKAEDALHAQQMTIAERDVDQDACIDALAALLAGDGLPRANPFKPLGFDAPSTLKEKGYAAEADALLKLVKAVRKRKGVSKAALASATAAEKAAHAVKAALAPMPKLLGARAAAIASRVPYEQAWETAFAALKRAARSAEDDGARGVYAALFLREATPAKGRAKKTSAKAKKGGQPATAAVPSTQAPGGESLKGDGQATA